MRCEATWGRNGSWRRIERIEKRRDPSPHRAPAKRAREESPKERNPKRRHSSGERLDLGNAAAGRSHATDHANAALGTDHVINHVNAAGIDLGNAAAGRSHANAPPRGDQKHLHGHTRQKPHVRIYSRSSAITKEVKLCRYCGKYDNIFTLERFQYSDQNLFFAKSIQNLATLGKMDPLFQISTISKRFFHTLQPNLSSGLDCKCPRQLGLWPCSN